jgi:hypothetical protein
VNVLETVFAFPAASVNVPAATDTVVAPSSAGVNVAVYTAPEPDNAEREPPAIVMSDTSKSAVAWPAVKT